MSQSVTILSSLVTILLLLTSCGIKDTYNNLPAQPGDYVFRFLVAANDREVDIDLNGLTLEWIGQHVSEDGTEVRLGHCENMELQVYAEGWLKMGDGERELLIFHELGHCVLGLEHEAGVMQSPLLSTEGYIENRDAYLDMLFSCL